MIMKPGTMLPMHRATNQTPWPSTTSSPSSLARRQRNRSSSGFADTTSDGLDLRHVARGEVHGEQDPLGAPALLHAPVVERQVDEGVSLLRAVPGEELHQRALVERHRSGVLVVAVGDEEVDLLEVRHPELHRDLVEVRLRAGAVALLSVHAVAEL